MVKHRIRAVWLLHWGKLLVFDANTNGLWSRTVSAEGLSDVDGPRETGRNESPFIKSSVLQAVPQ